MKNSMTQIVKYLLYYGTVFYLIFHFSIVALFVAPDNPISHTHKQEISDYIYPLFSQNWNLFAPNPINSNHTLEFQFHFINEKNDTTHSAWYDVLSSVSSTRKSLYFSPLQRIEKYISSLIEGTLKNSQELQVYSESLLSDSLFITSPDSLDIVLDTLLVNTAEHQIVKQYAKIVFTKLPIQYDADTLNSINFSYRIIDAQFPRFSDRQQDYYNKELWKISKYELSNYNLYNFSKDLITMKINNINQD